MIEVLIEKEKKKMKIYTVLGLTKEKKI